MEDLISTRPTLFEITSRDHEIEAESRPAEQSTRVALRQRGGAEVARHRQAVSDAERPARPSRVDNDVRTHEACARAHRPTT
jgi:hypothetical protein